jgi:hypothetical protein
MDEKHLFDGNVKMDIQQKVKIMKREIMDHGTVQKIAVHFLVLRIIMTKSMASTFE